MSVASLILKSNFIVLYCMALYHTVLYLLYVQVVSCCVICCIVLCRMLYCIISQFVMLHHMGWYCKALYRVVSYCV